MRPDILTPLFASVESLPGVGKKTLGLLSRLIRNASDENPISLGARVRIIDVLFHMPVGFTPRHYYENPHGVAEGSIATFCIHVGKHTPQPYVKGKRPPYRIACTVNGSGLTLMFFHADRTYLESVLPVGARRYVSGRVEYYHGDMVMVHPDHITPSLEAIPAIEPVYRLTAGLSSGMFLRVMRKCLERIPDLPEWQNSAHLAQMRWYDFRRSLYEAHFPARVPDRADSPTAENSAPFVRRGGDFRNYAPYARLAYDEFLAGQCALAVTRLRVRRDHKGGVSISGTGALRRELLSALPFSPTASQKQASEEILTDMAASAPMLRLLQGDVGSGKTLVAILAALTAVESGYQAALMAPTALLAQQHFSLLDRLCTPLGVRIGFLSGRERGKKRGAVLDRLHAGDIDILVGTHALFQEDVEFKSLAFVIIDEQHRFGVHQRLALQQKGRETDLLILSATPIPRTLTLALYGDIGVSRLTEKPAGRPSVTTRILPQERMDDVVAALHRAMAQGDRIYWICPLVEESDAVSRSAAETRFAHLSSLFPGQVGMIHGRLSAERKEDEMRRFQEGTISLLVATTVIEVGIDVPEAAIMVIENAETFGLAQLHQLRGRIGRGVRASTCLLLYASPLGETAQARLRLMRASSDGFHIAEEDLRLRGGGEMLGTRQSGLPAFRIADIAVHYALLRQAHEEMRAIIRDMEDDAGFWRSKRGVSLRLLLHLFERHDMIAHLSGG